MRHRWLLASLLAGASLLAAGQAQASARSLTVRHERASRIGSDRATVVAVISARQVPTTYRFEYGESPPYRSKTALLGARRTRSWLTVRGNLRHLRAGTTYRFRVVAHDRYGSYSGSAGRFTTARAAAAAAPGHSGPSTATALLGAPAPAGSAGPNRSLFWGAQIGTQFTGTSAPWDMNAVSAFATMVGKKPSIVPFNLPFQSCSSSCTYYAFPSRQMDAIRQYGAITMLNWSAMSSPMNVNEPAFRLAAVTSGAYDTYIRAFATAAAAWGHPFFLRFDWEMNGNWFPWAEAANGNAPGQFVAAWRHVHDIFTSVGATNATWIWCPTADPYNNMTSLSGLYPGASYVDWTCMDAYNFGGIHTPSNWMSFSTVVGSTYSHILAVAPTKPMIIAETASTEIGGSKAAWITDALRTQVPQNYSAIHAVVWFETAIGTQDWPVESSVASTNAFSGAVASPTYTSNTYAGFDTSPIPPP